MDKHHGKPRIRAARIDDAAAIARIVRESYGGQHGEFVPADMPLYHEEYHAQQLGDPANCWALLCQEGVPAGVACWRLTAGVAYLSMLFVRHQSQGHGYGVRLLRHFESSAIDAENATRVFLLHCLRTSSASLRFYKGLGYAEVTEGLEWRVSDLVLWRDACKAEVMTDHFGNDRMLLYRLAHH